MDDVDPADEFEAFADAHVARVYRCAELLTNDSVQARQLTVAGLRRVRVGWGRLAGDHQRLRAALAHVARGAARRSRADRLASPSRGLELTDTRARREPTDETTSPTADALASLTDRERVEVVLHFAGGLGARDIGRVVRRPLRVVVGELERATSFLAEASGADGDHADAVIQAALGVRPLPEPTATSIAAELATSLGSGASRTRRARWIAVAAAAVAAVTVGAMVAALIRSPADPVTAQAGATSPNGGWPVAVLPQTAAGLKLVGFQGLMLTVPASWPQAAVPCDDATGGVVFYPTTIQAAPCERTLGNAPSVSFGNAHLVDLPSLNRDAGDPGTDRVVVTSIRRERGGFVQFAALLDSDAVVAVRAARRGLVSAVISSAQQLPPGYAVVPRCVGVDANFAAARVATAGLTSQMFADPADSILRRPAKIVMQTPDVGTILPERSTVNLAAVPR